MPQSKEVKNEQTRLRMQKMRNRGVTESPESVTQSPDSVTGGQDWETLPLKDIKSALPGDIIRYIENVASKHGLLEQRLRRAYKYQVWHNENFINGIHKESKYRQFLKEGE